MCSMQYYMYIYVYVAFLLQCRTLIPTAFCSTHLCARNDILFNFNSARKRRLKEEFYFIRLFILSKKFHDKYEENSLMRTS